MTPADLDPLAAQDVIESLRSGIPPRRFVSAYSVGNEQFLDDVCRRQLEGPSSRGKIRFLSGSWGAGKTHFLRLLREAAFDAGYLVATVELSVDQTPFNEFEQVFFAIARAISSPQMYREGDLRRALPFGEVLRRALLGDHAAGDGAVSVERLQQAKEALFADDGIDVDFRRLVAQYWDTFLPDQGDPITVADTRAHLLQWFVGEGSVAGVRGTFQVQKTINRGNARLMLQSLSRFARHAGFRGLLVLFDEAEMAYSVMRRSNLKQAHNNLLHLINGIDESEGAILIYAATPDFFGDERYGVTAYGALAQRIGQPEYRPPRALDRVWNLDAIPTLPEHYADAAARIRAIYLRAEPWAAERLLTEQEVRERIAELVRVHPQYSHVSTWRVVVTGAVKELDRSAEGEAAPPVERLHKDIMAQLREQ